MAGYDYDGRAEVEIGEMIFSVYYSDHIRTDVILRMACGQCGRSKAQFWGFDLEIHEVFDAERMIEVPEAKPEVEAKLRRKLRKNLREDGCLRCHGVHG